MKSDPFMNLEIKNDRLILDGKELRGVIDYKVSISSEAPSEVTIKMAVNVIKEPKTSESKLRQNL